MGGGGRSRVTVEAGTGRVLEAQGSETECALLHLAGVADPTVYGYEGKILDFLVGA